MLKDIKGLNYENNKKKNNCLVVSSTQNCTHLSYDNNNNNKKVGSPQQVYIYIIKHIILYNTQIFYKENNFWW